MYGWRGVGEEVRHRPRLHDLTCVHHGGSLTDVGDDTEVVGDEQDRHLALRLQPAQQVEDLGLDGHVEGGGGFVGDEQLRVARERARRSSTRCAIPPENSCG